jgi:tetratricopeptide (TPR) repeat protein
VDRDLESVCLKCLEKGPDRRYRSAEALVEDLERWLSGRPVQARPVGRAGRALRWCRRNPMIAGLIAAVGMLALALVVGLLASTWYVWGARERSEAAYRAEAEQRRRAEERTRLARKAVDEMYTQVAEKWLASQPGMQQQQREFLEKALAFYEGFAREEGDDPAVRREAAKAQLRVGVIRHRLGRHAQAEQALGQAIARLERLAEESPDDPGPRSDLFGARENLGYVLSETGRVRDAERCRRQGLAVIERLAADYPADVDYRDALARQCFSLGQALLFLGEFTKAEAAYRRGVAVAEGLVRDFPREPRGRHDLGAGYGFLAGLLQNAGRLRDAEDARRKALGVATRLAADHPREVDYRQEVVFSRQALGVVLLDAGKASEAEECFIQALAAEEKLAKEYPDLLRYRHVLAQLHAQLGHCYQAAGRRGEAGKAFRTALQMNERLAAAAPAHAGYPAQVAWLLATCPDPGLRDPRRAVEWARKAVAREPANAMLSRTLGVALYRAGDWKGAVAALETTAGTRHRSFLDGWFFLAMARWQLGDKEGARREYGRAARWADECRLRHEELLRFRAEAEAVLGIKDAPVPGGKEVPGPKQDGTP